MKYHKKSVVLATLIITGILLSSCNNSLVPEVPAEMPAEEVTLPEEVLTQVIEFEEDTRMLVFDEVEWVVMEDEERILELGLDENLDFPGGFYVHNESETLERLPLATDAEVWLVNWDDLADPLQTNLKGLAERLNEYKALYSITIDGSEIVKVYEWYTP